MSTLLTLAETKRLFDLPEGLIYLDGNSLGAMPRAAPERTLRMLRDEWAARLIGGWTDCGWYVQPNVVGDRIGRLLGAPEGSVTMGDTLTLKVHQALTAALALNPGRRVILSDAGNFPSDLYMARAVAQTLGQGHVVETPPPEDVAARIGPDVAVLMLTEADYRSGRLHDMAALTALAHEHGVVTVWDLAHTAGAVPVDLTATNADFAVGCTYKYLNGGPGSPAFIYVAPRHQASAKVALAGWMGHAEPFAFDAHYRPAPGIARMRVGTPPVLALTVLETALDIWERVDMAEVRAAAVALSERFITGMEAACPDLRLISPRDPARRGSHVSFAHPAAYALVQALIAAGVVGDFRQPDVMRFGITPLYLDTGDIDAAVDRFARVIATRAWDDPRFRALKAVT